MDAHPTAFQASKTFPARKASHALPLHETHRADRPAPNALLTIHPPHFHTDTVRVTANLII
jgi:hypothetical protein